MEKQPKNQPPPYLSWKTFSNYLRSLNQAIPSRIDTSGMLTLNGSNRNLVKNALIFLGLTKEDGTPTVDLKPLVGYLSNGDILNFQPLLIRILTRSYPFLFEGFDLSTSTPAQFSSHFKEVGVSGDTIRKSEAFFIEAAKEAGLTISPYILGIKKRGPKSFSLENKLRKKTQKQIEPLSGKLNISSEGDSRSIMLDSLVSKFPDFDPSWPVESQTAWYQMYSRLLDLVEGGSEDIEDESEDQ